MKLDLTGSGVLALAAVAGVAGVGWLLYSKREAIGAAVNPLSNQNLAYQGATALIVPEGSPDSLGTWLYGLKAKYFPSDADKAAAAITAPSSTAPPVDATIMDRWDYYARGPIASEGRYQDPAEAGSSGGLFGFPSP